ncbi:MAG: DUF1559 domain-containing protein, partial [Planctomycetota bacterium]
GNQHQTESKGGEMKGTFVRASRAAFTLIEVLVAIGIVIVLLGLLLPSMRSARGAARRMACSNNLKQLGLSLYNYESTFNHFPSSLWKFDSRSETQTYSGLIELLPYLEASTLYQQVEASIGKVPLPSYPSSKRLVDPLWTSPIMTLQCPSDQSSHDSITSTSYVFCHGTDSRNLVSSQSVSGIFSAGMVSKRDDVLDGLSNTIAMGETATFAKNSKRFASIIRDVDADELSDLPNLDSGAFIDDDNRIRTDQEICDFGRGVCWADGAPAIGGFSTILPPNSLNLSFGSLKTDDGIYNASSLHIGGAHVLMGDGAVAFINDGVNPEVWASYGTRAGKETPIDISQANLQQALEEGGIAN